MISNKDTRKLMETCTGFKSNFFDTYIFNLKTRIVFKLDYSDNLYIGLLKEGRISDYNFGEFGEFGEYVYNKLKISSFLNKVRFKKVYRKLYSLKYEKVLEHKRRVVFSHMENNEIKQDGKISIYKENKE